MKTINRILTLRQKFRFNMNTFSIIAAVAQDNAIGKDGDLLWHIHQDMIFFKNTTKEHPVIMGRKTWESLQVRPLPKRENIVITSDENFAFQGVKVLHSVEQIMTLPTYDKEVFVIGGGSIYAKMLPHCLKLYITKVFNTYPDADTFFPEIDMNVWQCISQSEVMTDAKSNLQFQFQCFSRR